MQTYARTPYSAPPHTAGQPVRTLCRNMLVRGNTERFVQNPEGPAFTTGRCPVILNPARTRITLYFKIRSKKWPLK
ncbi:hypothetical protein EUP80_25655, partial [Salmonella enterica subsp. enterica serovar Bredeney]|nr:hypothetical protein [Salmonella enterica subsp. enterica serovar Bredeney]